MESVVESHLPLDQPVAEVLDRQHRPRHAVAQRQVDREVVPRRPALERGDPDSPGDRVERTRVFRVEVELPLARQRIDDLVLHPGDLPD